MRTNKELQQLRNQATTLRRAGKSRREIKAILGPMSNATLNEFLRGTPPPQWTKRPNAKDDLRARARDLRNQGHDYEEIAAELGVSKSSISLWVRDLPIPPRLSYQECRKRSAEGSRRYWENERALRDAQRSAARDRAAAEIGPLTGREILVAGALAYWCEGTKDKPHRRSQRVVFINSDAALISFFLRFLTVAGVPREDLVFRVYIHETADVEAARQFWLNRTGADASQFRATVLKRHNPKTTRRNIGEGYHGCLRIDVRRSGELYRKIEGWATAAMAAS
jgi:hypothetical protein